MTKAPAGGMTSVVNGKWYEGGEFMPDHGLFCDKTKSGARRQKVWDQNARRGRAHDLGGRSLFEISVYAGNGWRDIVGCIVADSHNEAELAAGQLWALPSKPSARKV